MGLLEVEDGPDRGELSGAHDTLARLSASRWFVFNPVLTLH